MFSKAFTTVCLISIAFSAQSTQDPGDSLNNLLADSGKLATDSLNLAGQAVFSLIPPTVEISQGAGNLGVESVTFGVNEYNDALDLAVKYQKEFNNQLLQILSQSQSTFNALLNTLSNPLDPAFVSNLETNLNQFLADSASQLQGLTTSLNNLVGDFVTSSIDEGNDANKLLQDSANFVGQSTNSVFQAAGSLAPAGQQVGADAVAVTGDLVQAAVDTVGLVGSAFTPAPSSSGF